MVREYQCKRCGAAIDLPGFCSQKCRDEELDDRIDDEMFEERLRRSQRVEEYE